MTASVFVMTAICPHGGQTAPLVFSSERHLKVLSAPGNRDDVMTSADSQSSCVLAAGDWADIYTAEQKLSYIVFDEAEQFRAIENKLTRR